MSKIEVDRATFDEVMVPCFAPMNSVPDRGRGSRVWDTEGRDYVDFVGCIAVTALGHAHPELLKVLHEQGDKLWHIGNGYTNAPVLRLAKRLTDLTFADRAFFVNSGAEANEAALKLARRYAVDMHGPDKVEIVSFTQSFHGRTFFTVSVGGQPKYAEGFGPQPQGIRHLPYNDLPRALEAIGPKTCAVIVELISDPRVLEGVGERSATIRAHLERIGARFGIFHEIRGRGLLLGAELADAFKDRAKDVLNAAANGVIMLIAGPNVLRFAPSFVMPMADLDEGFACIKKAIEQVVQAGQDTQRPRPPRRHADRSAMMLVLETRIALSEDSFRAKVDFLGEEFYLFVLEDTRTGELLGTSSIVASAGYSEPFYAFRNDALIHASRELKVNRKIHALTMSHELTGKSRLTGFYIDSGTTRCERRSGGASAVARACCTSRRIASASRARSFR